MKKFLNIILKLTIKEHATHNIIAKGSDYECNFADDYYSDQRCIEIH